MVCKTCYVPIISLFVGGCDVDIITTVHDYVKNSPPVPVVFLENSGQVFDLITSAHKYSAMMPNGSATELGEKRQELLADIKRRFNCDHCKADNLLAQVLGCVENKSVITIFRLDESIQLDYVLLHALLRARGLSKTEQLELALEWNRFDVIEDDFAMEVFVEALVNNQVDIVKLLLDKGLPVRKLFTKFWLGKLYNSEKNPSEALRFVIPDACSRSTVSLKDVDATINKYMGRAYCSKYHVKNSDDASKVFRQPFNELLVWSVLTKRHSMAKLMWQYGEETLAKALIAHNLYRAMAIEAKDDAALELEKAELKNYSAEFGQEAYELLDYCYRQDNGRAQELLTTEMPNWSYRTCLCLAFTGHHCKLLAHPCAQLVLGDLWLGGLRTRRRTKRKIFLFLIFPFLLPLLVFVIPFAPFCISCSLEFKSKDEIERFHMQQVVDTFMREGNYKCKRPSIKKRGTDIGVENGVSKPGERLLSKPDFSNITNMREPGWKMKLVAFYIAPITKYVSWSIAYDFFLLIFTYTLLIRTPLTPEWNELYVIAYIATFAVEKFREIAAQEPVKFRHKFSVWISNRWNCSDTFFILLFFTGLGFRLQEDTLDIGRVLYCINIVYW